MKKIRIGFRYWDNTQAIVQKINARLTEYDIRIETYEIKDYDDNRVYRTGERQLDTRIDGAGMRAAWHAI